MTERRRKEGKDRPQQQHIRKANENILTWDPRQISISQNNQPSILNRRARTKIHKYRIYVHMYRQMFVCKMSMCCPQTWIRLNRHAQPTINQSKLIITFFCRHIAPSYSSCSNKILWPMLFLLLCSKAMEFVSFWHPSHSILQCFQNCVKTHFYKQYHKWFQSLSSYLHAFVHVCVHVRVWCAILWLYNYYFWGFNVHIFLDLALVGEIRCCRNGCYYYYSHSIFLITFFPDSSISPLTKHTQLSETSSGWVHIYIHVSYIYNLCVSKIQNGTNTNFLHGNWCWDQYHSPLLERTCIHTRCHWCATGVDNCAWLLGHRFPAHQSAVVKQITSNFKIHLSCEH